MIRVRIVLLAAGIVALGFPLTDLIGGTPVTVTDYERELRRIDDAVVGRPGTTLTGPEGFESTRVAYLLYRRATVTGRSADLRAAEQAIGDAFHTGGASDDLYLLKANLDFRGHRLAATKADLDRLSGRADSVQVQLLKADVALQEGRHDEARDGY